MFDTTNYECQDCGKTFYSGFEARRHISSEHKNPNRRKKVE